MEVYKSYEELQSAIMKADNVKEFCLTLCREADHMLNNDPVYVDKVLSDLERIVETSINDVNERNEIVKEAMLVRGGALYRMGHYDEAIGLSNQALEIATLMGDIRGQSFAMNTHGAAAIALGDYETALLKHNGSLTLRKQIGDRALIAVSLMNIGNVYFALGDVAKALEYFMQSLTIREELGDEHGIGVSLSNIGAVYGMMGDVEQAIEFLQQSLSKKIHTQNLRGQVQTLGDLATQYLAADNLALARDYAQTSLDVAKKVSNTIGEAFAQHLLGTIEIKAHNYNKALQHIDDALHTRTEIGNSKGIVESMIAKAELLTKVGRNQEAITLLLEAQPRAEKLNSITLLSSLHQSLGAIYEDIGEFQEAIKHSKLYIHYHEKVFNQYNAERLRNLQILHQVENTRRENEIYRLRNIELAQAYSDQEKLTKSLAASNKELNEAIELLEKINKEKSEIFGIVAHDLRNPLTSIILTAGTTLHAEYNMSKNDIVNAMKRVKTTAERMADIIKKMVNLYNVESGEFMLTLEKRDIVPLVERIVDIFVPAATEKSIELKVETQDSAYAMIDKVVLEEIIDNLISNAIKFSPTGKTVTVKVSE